METDDVQLRVSQARNLMVQKYINKHKCHRISAVLFKIWDHYPEYSPAVNMMLQYINELFHEINKIINPDVVFSLWF